MLLERIAGLDVERVSLCEPQLKEEWERLWYRSARATIFQSPHWLLTWQAHFGGDDTWLITFRENGRLVGLAPLQRWTTNRRRMIFLGTGITDVLDVLSETTSGRRVAAALFEYLHLHEDEWDMCDFEQLPGTSPVVMEAAPPRWHSTLQMQEVLPVLALPESREQLERIRELAYLKRRLDRAGRVEFTVADESTFEETFDVLVTLHNERWEERGHPGVLSQESVRDFHKALGKEMLGIGALRLYALRVNDQPVAAYYGFHHRGRSTYYLSGFHPDWASHSVGTLIVGYAIERAIRERAVEFDFLRGSERYKYRWGARDRFSYRRTLER